MKNINGSISLFFIHHCSSINNYYTALLGKIHLVVSRLLAGEELSADTSYLLTIQQQQQQPLLTTQRKYPFENNVRNHKRKWENAGNWLFFPLLKSPIFFLYFPKCIAMFDSKGFCCLLNFMLINFDWCKILSEGQNPSRTKSPYDKNPMDKSSLEQNPHGIKAPLGQNPHHI